MSSFSFNKSGNDAKSNTLGSMNRQNVIQETNKKRTLLKDGSWIKRRPEEEEEQIRDENYGKSVLNRHKSQEDLDSATDKEKKPIHNRFKSDDALDRIPSRNTYEGGNKAATLERVPMSGPEATNKSRQSWAPSNKTTTTTITEESKRKSWTPTNRNTSTTTTTTTETRPVVPGKPEGQKITIYSSDTRTTDNQPRAAFVDSARSRFEKTEEKPSSPTSPRIQNVDEKPNLPPRSPIAKTDEWHSYPSKPVISESGERRSPMERKQRSQDIDNLIEISTTKEPSNKSTHDVDNLIDIKPTTEKAKKREQLDDFIEISNTARNFKRKDDNLDNLIEIKKSDVKTRTGNLDNLIDVKSTTTVKKGSQDLDDLISIGGDINKGTTKPASTNLTNRSSTTTTTYNVREEINDLPNRRSTTTTTYNVKEEAGDGPKRSSTTTTTYNVKEESNNAPNTRSSTTNSYNIMEGTSDVPSRRSTTTSKVTDYQDVPNRRSTTSSSYKVTDDTYDVPSRRTTTSYRDNTDGPNSRSNVTVTHETSYSSLPNSSYGDVSRNSSSNSYGSNIVSNSIKTVYSTSDRTVMEKDMCTYCRKPLGIDAKMILKDMNICCHATCFKCEACSGTLENLKAGDSMWIYKHTIHCEPCYFAAREKWII